MKKTLSILLTLGLLAILLGGCAGSTPEASSASVAPASSVATSQPEDSSAPAASAEAGETRIFTDSAGREVEVPATITKVAASGSSAQQFVFALAPDMLVGLSGEWSPDARQYLDSKYLELPVLGQFYGSEDLNLEETAALGPQLVIDIGETKDSIVEDMNTLSGQIGISVVHIQATTETTGEAFRMLGDLLDLPGEGEALATYCDDTYTRTEGIIEQVGNQKASMVYCLGDGGLSIIAQDSFHAEIMDWMTDNRAVVDEPSSKGTGNEVDMEQLLLWDPEVLLFAPDSYYAEAGEDPTWQQMQAIQTGRYYEVPFGPYNWMGFPPSVNRYMGMVWLAQLLYPETAQYDMFEETRTYYELFYHSELTQAQFDALVANSIGKS